MKKIIGIVATAVALISGCAETQPLFKPTPFNSENIDKLRIGMLASEIKEIFGAPNEVRTSTCGTATGKSWICETWRYERDGSNRFKTNDFTFDVGSGVKVLNNWNVGR